MSWQEGKAFLLERRAILDTVVRRKRPVFPCLTELRTKASEERRQVFSAVVAPSYWNWGYCSNNTAATMLYKLAILLCLLQLIPDWSSRLSLVTGCRLVLECWLKTIQLRVYQERSSRIQAWHISILAALQGSWLFAFLTRTSRPHLPHYTPR